MKKPISMAGPLTIRSDHGSCRMLKLLLTAPPPAIDPSAIRKSMVSPALKKYVTEIDME